MKRRRTAFKGQILLCRAGTRELSPRGDALASLGERGLVVLAVLLLGGIGPAIGNAAFHATGIR